MRLDIDISEIEKKKEAPKNSGRISSPGDRTSFKTRSYIEPGVQNVLMLGLKIC